MKAFQVSKIQQKSEPHRRSLDLIKSLFGLRVSWNVLLPRRLGKRKSNGQLESDFSSGQVLRWFAKCDFEMCLILSLVVGTSMFLVFIFWLLSYDDVKINTFVEKLAKIDTTREFRVTWIFEGVCCCCGRVPISSSCKTKVPMLATQCYEPGKQTIFSWCPFPSRLGPLALPLFSSVPNTSLYFH